MRLSASRHLLQSQRRACLICKKRQLLLSIVRELRKDIHLMEAKQLSRLSQNMVSKTLETISFHVTALSHTAGCVCLIAVCFCPP